MEPTVLRLAEAHDPFARDDVSERDRQEQTLELGLQQATLARTERVLDQARDLDCLTQAVYFEARSESPRGQAAVAQVVLNRVKNPSFPKSVCAVVYQGASRPGCQFSFACDGSMRRGLERSAWQRARKVAARAMAGVIVADVGSATHYHTTAVSPAWGARMLRVTQVGLHVFYKFNPNARYLQRAAEPAILVSAPAPAQPQLRLAVAMSAPAADAASSSTPAAGVEPSAPTPAPAQAAPKLQGSGSPAGLTPASDTAKASPTATTTAS
jgi:hypothetical protein